MCVCVCVCVSVGGCTLQPRFDECYWNLVCFTQVLEITCTHSVWRVGEGAAAPAPAPPSLPAAAPTRPSKSSPPPPSFRDLMRLDSTADDDAVPSPHALPQTKHHALADFDIDAPGPAPAASVATAAASQGERLLRQMQEKAAAGQGHVVGATVLMSKAYAMPAVKQVSDSLWGGGGCVGVLRVLSFRRAGVEHGGLSAQEARAAAAAAAAALNSQRPKSPLFCLCRELK